jgi:nicotinamide phosphoribosyltransferase
MTYQVPFTLVTDGYKVGHIVQYPPGTRKVFSNITPRKGRNEDDEGVIFFGLQAVIRHYLIDYARETFFDRDEDEVIEEYERAMYDYLGVPFDGSHFRALHRLGFLPLEIRAVEEGRFVPYGVPVLTIENTLEEFYWLTNYVETLLSSALWQATTSATTAFKYRVLLEEWADRTGSPQDFVPWQGHDFSFRGMSSPESALMSGMAHLTAFTGTDTIPAVAGLRRYYNATGLIGGSVPATEHSVMCAGGKDDELATFQRLLDLYPTGILSVVSDTWDLWKVLTEYLPALKDQILARNGKLVVRPDSGDPVKIICGDPSALAGSPQNKGVIRLLDEVFGHTLTDKGSKVLDSHVGCIYGDSITLERCNQICDGLAASGYASANMVFGIGSYTYQYVTRDTHGFAMKATWADVNGEENMLFKDPVTDDGGKRSARGRLVVRRDALTDRLFLIDNLDLVEWFDESAGDAMNYVFIDGDMYHPVNLDVVRKNVAIEVASKRLGATLRR